MFLQDPQPKSQPLLRILLLFSVLLQYMPTDSKLEKNIVYLLFSLFAVSVMVVGTWLARLLYCPFISKAKYMLEFTCKDLSWALIVCG